MNMEGQHNEMLRQGKARWRAACFDCRRVPDLEACAGQRSSQGECGSGRRKNNYDYITINSCAHSAPPDESRAPSWPIFG